MLKSNVRKFPRANYPCSLTLWQGNNFGTIFANTANIGAGGLLVYLNQPLMIGAKVEIRIDFNKQDSFECNGIVLRCQESQKDAEEPMRFFAVALTFEGLEETKVARIRELVDKIIDQENRV